MAARRGPRHPPYSRAPTAVLGAPISTSHYSASASASSGGGDVRPPAFEDAVRQRPGRMQLFVLGLRVVLGDNLHDGGPAASADGEEADETEAAYPLGKALAAARPRLRSVHGDGVSDGALASVEAMVVAAARARAKALALQRAARPPRPARPGHSGRLSSAGSAAPFLLKQRADDDTDSEEDDDVGRHVRLGEAVPPPAREHPDAFANAMLLTIRVGQALSVLPADALTGAWCPGRAAFAAVVSLGLSVITALSALKQFSGKKPSLVAIMVVAFYLMSAVTSWLFIRLARHWGRLLFAFRRQERRHGPSPGLRRKLNLIAYLVLGVSFVEHSLSEMNGIAGLYRENENNTNLTSFSECVEVYHRANFDMVVSVIGYWPLLSPFLFFMNFTATFLWNFNDLFIILLGVSLATRFKFLRESVASAIGHTVGLKTENAPVLGSAYWRSARRAYNALSRMARLMDEALSMQLLVSFVNNLYFISMQLLRGLDDPADIWYQQLYILFSFAFLVARTSAVSLLAASVNDQSRAMQDVLYCVCSEDYDEEVYRFLVQVTSEDVALSGCNMFLVTRSLLLTIAGTILTYEVVLVQLH